MTIIGLKLTQRGRGARGRTSTRLSDSGRSTDPHKRDFVFLQALSLRDKIVIMTPLQANRAGFDAAKDGQNGDEGAYANCNAIEWFSVAGQGMDVVLGAYYHGDLMKAHTMRLSW